MGSPKLVESPPPPGNFSCGNVLMNKTVDIDYYVRTKKTVVWRHYFGWRLFVKRKHGVLVWRCYSWGKNKYNVMTSIDVIGKIELRFFDNWKICRTYNRYFAAFYFFFMITSLLFLCKSWLQEIDNCSKCYQSDVLDKRQIFNHSRCRT